MKNSSNVDYNLNKKHSAMTFNFTQWNVAAVVCTVAWIPTGENNADAMTKLLSEIIRKFKSGNWTY